MSAYFLYLCMKILSVTYCWGFFFLFVSHVLFWKNERKFKILSSVIFFSWLGDSISSKIHIKLGVIHFLCSEWNTNLSDGPKFNFLLTEKQRRQRPNWTRDRELIYGLCKKTHSQSRIVLPANYIHYRWFIFLLFIS